ncbi:aldehyde dehydrogenase (NAD+) [Kroppenstedtia sanguinis]|uniref:aldehyde dehydrogenase n=1 Tax=Kroppenstedtia sanguinis TaxID=1380684 RepID=UPI003D1EBC53
MMDATSLLQNQRAFFRSRKTQETDFRLESLKKLRRAIQSREGEIMAALKQDLNKSEQEAFISEIGYMVQEISFVTKNTKFWARPQKVKTALTHMGSSSYIYPEPYGVSLIIAPWNYPFMLALSPLVGAVAAGNCVVLKPSELTPHVSALLADLIADTFDPGHVTVVEGGVETSTELLKQPFDKIFFTGSPGVGRVVMEAAAQHLTPVTLELGGKSPAIVDQDADLSLAAKRIAWGKWLNAGQTCVAPDYLWVHEKRKEELIQQLGKAIRQFYGETPLQNPDYTRIVNEKHFNRLNAYLQEDTTLLGGETDPEQLKIAPTLLEGVTWGQSVMEDEIFGPILPILTFRDLSQVVEQVTAQPKPLALYYFSNNRGKQEKILRSISFGGGCINDTIMHLATPHLPFGGVGNSGLGNYHGKHSFDCFSHQKSVLKQTQKFDLPFRYPSSKNGLKLLRRIMK